MFGLAVQKGGGHHGWCSSTAFWNCNIANFHLLHTPSILKSCLWLWRRAPPSSTHSGKIPFGSRQRWAARLTSAPAAPGGPSGCLACQPRAGASSAPTSAAGKLQGSLLEWHGRENMLAADWRAFSGERRAVSSSATNKTTNTGMRTCRVCTFELIKAGGT